ALKGNQETLHQEVIDYIDEQSTNDFADVKVRRHLTEEKGHGREGCNRSSAKLHALNPLEFATKVRCGCTLWASCTCLQAPNASHSLEAHTERTLSIASAPAKVQRIPPCSMRSLMTCRQAPSITPVAIG